MENILNCILVKFFFLSVINKVCIIIFSFLEYCRKYKYFVKIGEIFVNFVVRLMERFLDYRIIMYDENKENRMSCIVNVLVSKKLIIFLVFIVS